MTKSNPFRYLKTSPNVNQRSRLLGLSLLPYAVSISALDASRTGRNGNMRGTSKREDILDTVILLEKPTGYKPEEEARFKVTYQKKNRGFSQHII
jgi:hypothetical protein